MQTFIGIPLQAYVGIPYGYPAPFKSNTGWIKYCPLFVDWAFYGASSSNNKIGIEQDLKGTVAAQLIPKVVSVYIDNLGSNVPVYTRFPSTGFVIAAPPNSADWYNCISSDLRVEIYGIGFVTGQIPKTNFYFTDAYVPPYSNFEQQNVIDKWLASAVISRGQNIFNQDYGVPALGDQTFQTRLDAKFSGSSVLFGTPLADGFIYLTDIWCLAQVSTQNTESGQCVIESTGVSGVLYTFDYTSLVDHPENILLYSGKGNLKISATELWRLRISIPLVSGNANQNFINLVINYTTNPN